MAGSALFGGASLRPRLLLRARRRAALSLDQPGLYRRGRRLAPLLARLLALRRVRLVRRLRFYRGHHYPHALHLLLGVHHARWRRVEPGYRGAHPRGQERGREDAQHRAVIGPAPSLGNIELVGFAVGQVPDTVFETGFGDGLLEVL